MRIILTSLLSLLLMLSACGFQLRGDVELPAVMERTFVDFHGSAGLQRSIARALELSGVQVVNSREQASAVLRILSAPVSQRVVAKDERGRAREYEITVGLRYVVTNAEGAALMESQNVRNRTNLLLDPSDPLTNQGDINYYVSSMRADSIWEMLRRIAATPLKDVPLQAEEDAAGTTEPE